MKKHRMLALWMIVLAGVIGVESVQAQTFSGDRNARAGLTIRQVLQPEAQ